MKKKKLASPPCPREKLDSRKVSDSSLLDPIPNTGDSSLPDPFHSLKILVSDTYLLYLLKSISKIHLWY